MMIMLPDGAQAAAQALQLGQSSVPDLQIFNSSLQVVGELGQLLHCTNILHEDLLLEEEEVLSTYLNHHEQSQMEKREKLLCPP